MYLLEFFFLTPLPLPHPSSFILQLLTILQCGVSLHSSFLSKHYFTHYFPIFNFSFYEAS